MSQMIRTSLTFLLLLSIPLFALAGCSSSNSQSNFNPDTGQHPAGWLPDGHKTAALPDLESCTQCHGADYAGGISAIACTSCHIGNQQAIHPTEWGPFGFILHADYVNTNTNATCANALCHGTKLNGVGGTGPSCTSCHMGGVGSMHPLWGTPAYAMHGNYVKNNNNDTSGCANAKCHGTSLDGAGGAGPSCTSCHMGSAASIHPSWGTPAYAFHGTYVKSNSSDTSGCANVSCHGTALTGVSESGPSCTLCHMGGVLSFHPAEWNRDVGHESRTGYTNYDSCRNIVCHGADLEGVYLSGHSCYRCHNPLP